jgi:GxxExxY protein
MITQKSLNQLAYKVVACAIEVHRELGPGLLECVYEQCFIDELADAKFEVRSQVPVPLLYKGKKLDFQLKLDLVINDLLIIELKSVVEMNPVFKAQLLTYLRLTGKPKGLLINFNCENITKHGLIPMVTDKFARLPKDNGS